MTAPDYVAEVAELLTDHHIVPDGIRCNCEWLIRQGADGGPSAGAHAAHLAEVLAAAGLIPTSTEWGIRHSQGIREERNERWAREWAAGDVLADSGRKFEARGRTQVVSRAVTDWKDAT